MVEAIIAKLPVEHQATNEDFMTPLIYYRQICSTGQILEDVQQLQVLQHLEKIYQKLLHEYAKRKGLFSILRRPKLIKGLYIWGNVGVGKTFLMDCFFRALPFEKKQRMHFYQFMDFVHQELKKYQGKADPLQIIAKKLAQKALVLCFDEFFVSEIVDAMLLERLLQALFAAGVCLVATSNSEPDELYKKGLQRQHFLPAIALLKKKTDIIHLAGAVDYRLRHLRHAGVFYIPNDALAQDNMEKSFSLLADNKPVHHSAIELFGRKIPIIKAAGDIIWFDFNVICGKPRSQQDYLALVKKYTTIFISDIPILLSQDRDKVVLFIRLVDVLYDARIRLVMSAAPSLEQIYSQGELKFDFTRTLSRLIEMQSENYFLQ